MKHHAFPWRAIKSRVTLFTLAIFIVSLWALSFFASRTLQSDIERLAGQQQFTTAHIVAGKVNEQLVDRISALQGVASRVTPAMLVGGGALQSFLEQRPSFNVLFNAGYFVTDTLGTAQASVPVALGRVGVNYMDRDFVGAALKDGKAKVGTPVLGKLLKVPVFGIAVPIRDEQGTIIGSLAGVIDLSRPGFLDNITDSSYGAAGGYLLIDSANRIIITATDKRRIMEVLVSGFNPLADRFIRGEEGTGVAVNPKGVEVLASGHNIPVANWHVVVFLPTAEAFAPVKAMQTRLLLVTLVLTLLASALTYWMIRRELSPLLAAAHTLAQAPATGMSGQLLAVVRHDEVGALVSGFNRLLCTLSERQLALAESESRLTAILDQTHIHLWAFNGSTYSFVNKQWFDFTGQHPAQGLRIELWTSAVHPQDLPQATEVWLKHWETKTGHDNYFRLRRHDGVYRDFHCHTVPVCDEHGVFQYFQGFNLDITKRKGMEDALRVSEEQHRQLIENSHDIIYTLDAQGVFTFVSGAWTRLLGHTQDQVLGQPFAPFVHPDDLATCFAALGALFETGERQSGIEYRVRHLDGTWCWHSSNAVAIKDPAGKVIAFEGNAKDISEQKMAQTLDNFRRQTLELLVGDADLNHVFETLVLGVQAVKPEMLCSVLLLSADGKHLGQGVAPSLPDFYNAAINGIEIGVGVGSCGTAAFTAERVAVEDIRTHPYWAPYKALAAQAGLGACWSQPILGAGGHVLGTFAIYHRAQHTPDAHDIALIEQSANLASIAIEKTRTAQALRVSERRLALAVGGASEGIWDLHLLTGELYHSPAMAHMLGYTETELPARREAWDALTNQEDAEHFRHEMGRHFKNPNHPFDVLVRLRHKDGSWRWVQSRGQATRDAQGRAVRFLGTQFDVTERKQLEDQVRQLAYFDALTGLPNRRMLEDRLTQTMAAGKRSALYGALMFLDLDNFKPLNDTHGHGVGDLLLIEVAARLSACVREVDTVARVGGDEFVVVLSELGPDMAQSTEQARSVAEKIRTSLGAPYQLRVMQADGGEAREVGETTVAHRCTTSIGVAMFLGQQASQMNVMKWADAAMYQAKADGRNVVCLHQPPITPLLATPL